ncbi:MAG TPA: SDR family oxidoreductase [Magnetospirillaceae bacterium]|jgi:NAD(P)-dependent dehydrogenase (short-subunit alcohol dehydrogenase family)
MSEVSSRPVAIVTAASQGIGLACAQELAKRGYAVSLLARSERVKGIAEGLGGIATVGSVTEAKDLATLHAVTMEKFGRIDAVVNNTGSPPKGDLLAIEDDAWRQGSDIILMNVIRLARLVVPEMQKRKSGAFVNISAYGAITPDLAFPVSSVLRAALGSFTKLFAQRYAADGIRMNAILPGFVDSYPVNAERVASIPMGRYAKTTELAGMVAYLLSEESVYVTGQSILFDGGMVRSI